MFTILRRRPSKVALMNACMIETGQDGKSEIPGHPGVRLKEE